MKILQSLTSLMLSPIFQLVINFHHRLREMCGLQISMEKSLSQLKVYLMKSTVIKLHGVNQRSRSVYAEGRATKGQILNKFALDLIKSDLWFNILKFVSQRNLPHQRILVMLQAVLRDNSGKKTFFFNMTRIKMLAFSQLQTQKNPSLKEQKSSVHSLLLVLRKVIVLMHGNLLHTTVQMGVLILKVFILINHTVQWHMLTHS